MRAMTRLNARTDATRAAYRQPIARADVEAVRDHKHSTGPDIRFYQAGSSEMFGGSAPPQSETTPFQPRCPYAVDVCKTTVPPLRELRPDHLVACHRAEELKLLGVPV